MLGHGGSAADIVLMQKLDNTQHSAGEIATGGEGLRFLKVPGVTPLEGGFPVIVGGKIIGGIGTSGVLSSQDTQVSTAGLEALK